MPGACFDFEGAAWVDLADSIAVGGREYDLYQTSVDTRFPHLFLFVYRFHCPTGVRKESRECPVAMNGDAVAVDTINRRSCCAVSVVLMAQRRREQYRQCTGACAPRAIHGGPLFHNRTFDELAIGESASLVQHPVNKLNI